jgi:hypothetical protein
MDDARTKGGRPRKSDEDKIAPIKTGLPQTEFDDFYRIACDRVDGNLAELAREYIREGMRREVSRTGKGPHE